MQTFGRGGRARTPRDEPAVEIVEVAASGDGDGELELGAVFDPLEPGRDLDALLDELPADLLLKYDLNLAIRPRSYQTEALNAWIANRGRGVVVLPTGAGKTVLALMAMQRVGVQTLVVVPTIELLHQWRQGVIERLGLPESEVGIVGGGKRQFRPITVITYDSAMIRSRQLGSFGLAVFDEVHHLPAQAYRRIAERLAAPFRLGLSATPERADMGHLDLERLVGPEIYRKSPVELAREKHIASFREKRVYVDLSPEEQHRYEMLMAEYRWCIASSRLRGFSPIDFFQSLIQHAGSDPQARRALQAHHEARLIAMNAEAKIGVVEELLDRHRDDLVIVFSEYTSIVDLLSRRLALPAITYKTDAAERRLILERFRARAFTKLITGRVLNEGVDVPDASVAIVVSGSAARREYIQRLGRVLRPKPDEALLYELVTRRTSEVGASRRRRGATRRPAADRVA